MNMKITNKDDNNSHGEKSHGADAKGPYVRKKNPGVLYLRYKIAAKVV